MPWLGVVAAYMEDETDWRAEAMAVIQDVRAHVKDIHLAKVTFPSRGVYLNLTTIEGQDFCVMLGPSGFLIVGNAHDDVSQEEYNQTFYETPYALLGAISPSYDQSFGNLLIKKLNELNNQSVT